MEDLTKLSKQELIDRLNQSNQFQSNNNESELSKVDRIVSGANPYAMPFKQHTDHKSIYLYTELNRKIGPYHPENAKDIIGRWSRKGFNLYVNPRTSEQIEAYKNSPLGKKRAAEKMVKDEKRKLESSKGKTEQFAKEIAKETALAVASTLK